MPLPNSQHGVTVDKEEWKFVETVTIGQRGGSKGITIPPEVMEALGVSEGDKVAYFVNKARRIAMIVNAKHPIVKIPDVLEASLTFSLSEELVKKFLKKKSRT